jgi:hypothetical protein
MCESSFGSFPVRAVAEAPADAKRRGSRSRRSALARRGRNVGGTIVWIISVARGV